MKRRYFNLNIRHPKWDNNNGNAATHWLDQNKACVFYGENTVEDLLTNKIVTELKKSQKSELLNFLTINDQAKEEEFEPIIITINSGWIWIYKLIGKPITGSKINLEGVKLNNDQKRSRYENDVPKYYEIELLTEKKLPSCDAPYILASMRSNQAFSRKTFTEIGKQKEDSDSNYQGNIAAIQSIIGWEEGFKVDPYQCISSIQFETLIAKIYESDGFFVPAHRGGTLDTVDLFAKKLNVILSIQLKISLKNGAVIKEIQEWLNISENNYLITPEKNPSKKLQHYSNSYKYLTRDWITQKLKTYPTIKVWMDHSLEWLPETNREKLT